MAIQIDLKKYGAGAGRFLGWADFGIAPQGKEHSLRAIPRNPPEARPPAWLSTLS
jgi:hypothetical protein